MSYQEEPASHRDFGDLFGSDDEASDIDDGRSESPKMSQNEIAENNFFGSEESDEEQQHASKQNRSYGSDEEDIRGYSDEDNDAERYDQYSTQRRKKDRVEVTLQMPQLPLPYSDNNKFYLAKLPRFLDVEVDPFVAEEFNAKIEEGLTPAQERESIREQIENTIRWRRVMNELGEETMQSNAHLVEWENGKVSLMLGDECFDVGSKPVSAEEHVFLLAHQTESGALESQVELTDHMTLMPSSLKSDTHRHITAQIADRQVKKNKTKMFYTEKDPELLKHELELQEAERLKAQKKLEAQRKKTDMRYEGGSRRGGHREFGDYDTTDDYNYRQASRAQDRYEDDFVIDDDDYDEEEEKLREDRLAHAKRSNMGKYKRQHDSEEEEEEEEGPYGHEDDEDDEDDEEVVVRRAKRNRIASDEDD
ncbi:Leo1-like protein-domain-containing protein [Sporodiniella umbellata]|nr:Leo1-like protein-domain-containing protein [Sporodiniella umbellata]